MSLSTASSDAYLAVDIGGTKISVGVVNTARTVVYESRVSTPTTHVWESLAKQVSGALAWTSANNVRLLACGVGCGGPMRVDEGIVSPLHIPEWNDFSLVSEMQELVGLDVVLENDAKALVLAEHWSRREKNINAVPSIMMSVLVSTGVGAGIIADEKLLMGRTGNAGHIGHVIVQENGNKCACGARGCLEAHISGPAIERAIGAPASKANIQTRVAAGMLLGQAIASVAATMDLTDVTVGGSVALGFGDEFFQAAQISARKHAGLSFLKDLTISPVADRSLAPLVGAAALAKYSIEHASRL